MTSSTTDRRLGLTGGTAYKAPCDCATTANITLSGEQIIDGITTDESRVLAKNQDDATENGIYDSDTGSWTRALDFDGINDVVNGTQVYVVVGGSSNGGSTFVLSFTGTISFGTTSLSFTQTAAGVVTKASSTATAGQTVVTVATYAIGANALEVYVNGLRQRVTADYTETSTTSITMTYALQAGDEVDAYSQVAAGALTAAAASGVTVADAGDFYAGTTVEAVLQEIAYGIASDVGDADATLIYNSSSRVQRWNTALSANRTATISTTGAKEGSSFVVVRGAGATGNYTLAVGSLATLRAPGEWCVVGYDVGLTAWILLQYGILPSAEILALSSDNGDASATITVGTSARTQRWATTLTADRNATLSTTGAYTGARFRIVRTEASSGLYALYVVGAATLATLLRGQWCDVEYTGTAWIVVASGNIRTPNTNVIGLYDDFLGEEIDGYSWQSLIGTDSTCQQAILNQDQARGFVRLTTGADAGATMALNGCQLQSALNWQANQGGLVFEARVMMSAVTAVCVYVGLTDQVAALEMPFTLGAGDALTSNATDAVGVLFDTAADTDDWWLVGVAGDMDATKQDSGVAPSAAVVVTWRIEVTSAGVATFYRNDSLIGTAMTGAVTPGVALTPVVATFARGASSRNIDADFIALKAQR